MSREWLPHEQRVVQERTELQEKITKLLAFFNSDTFRALPQVEKHFMFKQHDAMMQYSTALDLRIGLFELKGARVK